MVAFVGESLAEPRDVLPSHRIDLEGQEMSHVILTMAMSLDGFITGPEDDAENPAGIDGMRLMDWLGGGGSAGDGDRVEEYRPSDPNSRIVYDEMLSTGAVITGRRTGDFAGYWGGDHHDGVPIFVPTHEPPAENPHQRVHYVTEGIEACVEQAKAAAGDRDVMMHGAYTAQEALKAGVLDVIEIQLRPVLLGQGRRLFDGLPPEHIELNLARTLEAPGVLHLRYEVRRA
jgi:dihydrofolate reductase